MNLDPKWVPMNWPCGPLEWAWRNKSKSVGAELKDTLDAWAQPAALDVLKGTPINCLVVEWAEGAPEDSAQQQALKPLIEAGRGRGIDFVGRVAAGGGTAAAVASAQQAGLSAVMLTEPPAHAFDFPVILSFPRDKVAWESATSIFSSAGNDWPGLKLATMMGDDTAIAGPPVSHGWIQTPGFPCYRTSWLREKPVGWIFPRPMNRTKDTLQTMPWQWPTARPTATAGSSPWTTRFELLS